MLTLTICPHYLDLLLTDLSHFQSERLTLTF